MNQQRVKWHANRDKPTTLNPSRRRRDFGQLIQQFAEDLQGPPAYVKYAPKGTPTVGTRMEARYHEKYYHPDVEYTPASAKVVTLNRNKKLIMKRNPEHLTEIKKFENYVRSSKQDVFEIVSLKISKEKSKMQYVRRPSLGALRMYLEGQVEKLGAPERLYCMRLLSQARKKGISGDQMLTKVLHTSETLHDFWRSHPASNNGSGGFKFSIADLFEFSTANFLAIGTNTNGKLKIAFIDA